MGYATSGRAFPQEQAMCASVTGQVPTSVLPWLDRPYPPEHARCQPHIRGPARVHRDTHRKEALCRGRISDERR